MASKDTVVCQVCAKAVSESEATPTLSATLEEGFIYTCSSECGMIYANAWARGYQNKSSDFEDKIYLDEVAELSDGGYDSRRRADLIDEDFVAMRRAEGLDDDALIEEEQEAEFLGMGEPADKDFDFDSGYDDV